MEEREKKLVNKIVNRKYFSERKSLVFRRPTSVIHRHHSNTQCNVYIHVLRFNSSIIAIHMSYCSTRGGLAYIAALISIATSLDSPRLQALFVPDNTSVLAGSVKETDALYRGKGDKRSLYYYTSLVGAALLCCCWLAGWRRVKNKS